LELYEKSFLKRKDAKLLQMAIAIGTLSYRLIKNQNSLIFIGAKPHNRMRFSLSKGSFASAKICEISGKFIVFPQISRIPLLMPIPFITKHNTLACIDTTFLCGLL
jgi:hypothetical protein